MGAVVVKERDTDIDLGACKRPSREQLYAQTLTVAIGQRRQNDIVIPTEGD
jgi:hypothetical protein